jgi:hypothetical protein
MREIHLAIPLNQVLLLPRPDPGPVILEPGYEGGGTGGASILIAFPCTDGQGLHRIIAVLHAPPDRFHDPQPTPLEALGD